MARVGPLAIALLGLPPATTSAAEVETKTRAEAARDEGGPGFFVIGPQQIGLALGYGHGIDFAGSGVIEGLEVRELVILPHWQIAFTRAPREPAWYKGRVGLRAESSLYLAFAPQSGVAFGLTLLFRYDFVGWGRYSPYFQIGAGPLWFWFDIEDQANGIAFNPQAGLGVTARLGDHLALDLGWRFVHVSNAYTHSPNGGFDSMQILLGVAYHF